ncbi:MAG: GGDEF domain-containing protein [Spirochaetaceae bacterium]
MFDIKIIIIIAQMFIPLFFIIIQFEESGWTKKNAIKLNIGANFSQFIGYLIVLFSFRLQYFWVIDLSNLFILISFSFVLVSTLKLFNVDISKKLLIGWVTVSFILTTFSTVFLKWHFVSLCIMTFGPGILFLYSMLLFYLKFNKINRPLLKVFISEFIIISICLFIRFFLSMFCFNKYEGLFSYSWVFTLYIIGNSLFMLVWNYTIQLKRASQFKTEIEGNVDRLYKIQEDLSILNHVYYENSISCSLTELYSNIFDIIYDRFSAERIILYLEDQGNLVPVYYRGVTLDEIHNVLSQDEAAIIRNEAFYDMKVSEVYVGNLPEGNLKKMLLSRGLIGAVSFPLCTRGVAIGSLSLGISSNSTIINKDREIFLSICRQVAGVIYSAKVHNELLESQSELKKMATTDQLTGIFNRQGFLKQFKGEFSSALRHKDFITLFMLDIINLKKVNDKYGTDIGDQVLVEVTGIINKQFRENDLFARYGDKEFAGALLKSHNSGALCKLQKIVDDVSSLKLYGYPDLKIIVSLGFCHFIDSLSSADEMLKRASHALTEAKKIGDNKLSEG